MPKRQAAAVERTKDEQKLPHDLEAERAVLGSILLHSEVFDVAADIVGSTDFFRDAHRRIFAAMGRLVDLRRPVEWITLREELERTGELVAVGGPAYVSALVDGIPRSVNIEHYAGIVLEKSKLRAAIQTSTKLSAEAYDGAGRAVDLISDAAERLYAIGAEAAGEGGAVKLSDLTPEGMQQIERAHDAGGVIIGQATGFLRLDEMTAGLHPADLVIVAARTSQGKTAFAMNIAQHVGASESVLVFSLEMSRLQLFTRILAAASRVDTQILRTGSLLGGDWKKLSSGLEILGDLKIWVDDQAGIGVREVRARARQIKAKHGLGLIVVDYIQLMRGRGSFDTRTQEIASITRGLKAVAKELGVPVIAISQLSRAAEAMPGRKARAPQLSDLAESASLENDADVVLLIWRR